LKYAAGKLPLDDFHHDFPDIQELAPVDLLDAMLGHAVDELSRPIDAIRHQAKTVTVGTSRKESLSDGPVAALLRTLAFDVHALLSTNILLLDRLQKAVQAINGYTLYGVYGLDSNGRPVDDSTLTIEKRGGISERMPSRVVTSKALIGTKKGIVASGRIYAGQGKTDGAQLLVVPLLGENEQIAHLLLIHVSFNEDLSPRERMDIIGKKANDIRNLVQECNLAWDESLLAALPVGVLLGESAEAIVGRIRDGEKSYCR
jgi:glucosamine--fructose-6-phosphate aminotransferase (isomerizing)